MIRLPWRLPRYTLAYKTVQWKDTVFFHEVGGRAQAQQSALVAVQMSVSSPQKTVVREYGVR